MKNIFLIIATFFSAFTFAQFNVNLTVTSVSASGTCDSDGGFSGNSDFRWDVSVDDNRDYSETFGHEVGENNSPGTVSSNFDNPLNFNGQYGNGEGGNITCPPTFLNILIEGEEADAFGADLYASNTITLPVPSIASSSTFTETVSVAGCNGTVTYTFNFAFSTVGTPHFECADEPCDATTQLIQDPCDATLNYSEYDVSSSTSTFPGSSTGCSFDADNDIFFKFIAPSTGSISVFIDDWGDYGAITQANNTGAIYEGNCNSLSIATGLTIAGSQGGHNTDCLDFSSGTFNGTNEGPFNISDLTPGQDYYMRVTEEDDQSAWIGLAFVETLVEDDCINAEPLSDSGCNYNADANNEPDDNSWTGQGHTDGRDVNTIPGPDDISNCDLDWFSNENMVWYTFDITPTTSQPVTITVEDINCDGTGGGSLQMGIWRENGGGCAPAGGANGTNGLGSMVPVGCDVGSAGNLSVTLPDAMPVDRYYVAMDGNAGAQCVWEFASDQVLPVEFIYFEAKSIDNNYVLLEWETASEINNAGFELQRSIDGKNFDKIDWISGSGNSNDVLSYDYQDKEVSNGTYYYRLKQIDYDGQYEYSDIAIATLYGRDKFSIGSFIPNPASNSASLEFTLLEAKEFQISIYDYIGRLIDVREVRLESGVQNVFFDTENFTTGSYSVVIQSDSKVDTKKLMISK